MTIIQPDLSFTPDKFNELFPLEKGQVVLAGGKRAGQTAGLARYTVVAGRRGREHVIELGYGTVPERANAPKEYPLLLPKLDSQLGRFNIDGNTHNVLILRFREQGGKLALQSLRNFNAPCEIETGPHKPNARLALAVLEVARARIGEIMNNKINAKQDPKTFIMLINHAIEMRVGHMIRQRA